MKKIYFYVIPLMILFFVGGYLLGSNQKDKSFNPGLLSGGFDKGVSEVTTDSSVTLQTSTTTVLSANFNRDYALIVNDSDATVYLHLNEATTTNALNSGIRLNASGGSYEITPDNPYTGEISATSTVSGGVLTVVEW